MVRFGLGLDFVFLLKREDCIIVEKHMVNTVHSAVEGAMLADGAFAGPIFLSQVGHFLTNWGCFLEGVEKGK